MHALRCHGSAVGLGHLPRRHALRRCTCQAQTSRSCTPLLVVDLDSVVATSALTAAAALTAASVVWPEVAHVDISATPRREPLDEPDSTQQQPSTSGSSAGAGDLPTSTTSDEDEPQGAGVSAGQSPLLQLNLTELLCRLNDPDEAVLLMKLLHDELVTGRQQHRAGQRRTRPFRLAEISSALLHSRDELLAVCLARWALAAGSTRSTAQLREDAQAAFRTTVQQFADSPAVAEWLPVGGEGGTTQYPARASTSATLSQIQGTRSSGSSSSSSAPCQAQQAEQQSEPQRPTSQQQVHRAVPPASAAGAADAFAQVQVVPSVCNLVLAAREHYHVQLVSVWPQRLAAALALRCGLLPAHQAASSQDGRSNAGSPRPGLSLSCAATFEEGVLEALSQQQLQQQQQRQQQGAAPWFVVTTNAQRASRAASACTAWQEGGGGEQQQQQQQQAQQRRRQGVEVLLSDALATSAQAKVALGQQQQHPGVRVVDDARMAELLGLSESRLVMDGVRL